MRKVLFSVHLDPNLLINDRYSNFVCVLLSRNLGMSISAVGYKFALCLQELTFARASIFGAIGRYKANLYKTPASGYHWRFPYYLDNRIGPLSILQ